MMRIATIGLAFALIVAVATASRASAPTAIGGDLVNEQSNSVGPYDIRKAPDEMVIARRDRGGDDHGRHRNGKHKGGKRRGGQDDGPNHDRDDDHGHHGPNHT